MLKHIHFFSKHFCFWSLLSLALIISGMRFALTELKFFKTEIESQLTVHLGHKVSIDHINGVLNGIKPELALYNIKIHTQQADQADFQLQEVRLGLQLFNPFQYSWLEAIQLSIVGADLSIKRLKSGSITIQGLPQTEEEIQPTWLMQGRQFKLIDSDINWHDEKRNAAPIQLDHVNITIANRNDLHKINISMSLPETLGQSLRLVMRFTGDMFTPNSVDAELFVQGKGIQLAKVVTGRLPFDFSFIKGRGDFALWSTWKAAQMTELSGSILMDNVALTETTQVTNKKIQSAAKNIPIDQLKLQFKAQKKQQQWHLALKNVSLNAHQENLELTSLAFTLGYNTENDLEHIALNCPLLDLGRLSRLITLNQVLPKPLHQQIKKLAPQGMVKDLLFTAEPLEKHFAISGQLNNIHTLAFANTPGVDGLSLYIKGTEQQGKIYLSSQKLAFNAPKQFQSPLRFKHVLGELNWLQNIDSWELSSPMLALNTKDLKSHHQFKFKQPKNDNHNSFLDLKTAYYDGRDAKTIRNYLPKATINNPELYTWLENAFLAGSIKQGGLLFRGDLKNYPFRNHKGVFESLFNIHGLELNYDDHWPNATGVSARVRFFADSLNVNVYKGMAQQLTIDHARVNINSFAYSKSLSITGESHGSIAAGLHFLKQTPYQEQTNTVNQLVDIQGLFSSKLDLEIPLKNSPTKINIGVNIAEAQAQVASADLQFSNIKGQFNISEQGILSEHLTADTLGYPVNIQIDNQAERTKIILAGKTDITHANKQLPNQAWSHLTGATDYQVQLNIPSDGNKNTQFALSTELKGIAIDFPPWSKTQVQSHPFKLKLSLNNDGINAFSAHYKPASKPDHNLDISLNKIHPNWQGLFHSSIASGSVFIPIGLNKYSEISLLCDHLNLSALEKLNFNDKKGTYAIHNFPSTKLEVQKLYWNKHNLGKLSLLTQPADEGVYIKQLKLDSPLHNLSLSGLWALENERYQTSIQGQLLSQDFGQLLSQFSLSDNIERATADFKFSLNWADAPHAFSKNLVSGEVEAELLDGQILGVNPGLGRILGALDIWKLSKRLRFDFSDVTEKGLSFSTIKGTASISHGLAKTKNLFIDAMPAEIHITGTTHLETEKIDLLATVQPKYPIAGTIIGDITNAITEAFIGKQKTGGVFLNLLYKIKGTWSQFDMDRQFNPALDDALKKK
ncbi:MAG: hypothetical protein GQ582_05610 [Methyloprofundus sp.]|nr:hypothetical protein [Methyloprofundus sp.]